MLCLALPRSCKSSISCPTLPRSCKSAILSFQHLKSSKLKFCNLRGTIGKGGLGPLCLPCAHCPALCLPCPYRGALRPALPCPALPCPAPHAMPSLIWFSLSYGADQPKHSELSIGALKNPPWQEIIPNSIDFLARLPNGSCRGTQHTVAHDHTTCTYATTRMCARNAQECARASARGIKIIGTIISINPRMEPCIRNRIMVRVFSIVSWCSASRSFGFSLMRCCSEEEKAAARRRGREPKLQHKPETLYCRAFSSETLYPRAHEET